MSRVVRKLVFRVFEQVRQNRTVEPEKMARACNFGFMVYNALDIHVMTVSEGIHVAFPMPTQAILPSVTPLSLETKVMPCRVPRSKQLQLARGYTFGVLGDDNDLFPSINWETEKQGQFRNYAPPRSSGARGACVLDSRKHNPQSRKIFRIKGINKKPICTVDDQRNAPTQETLPANTVYMTAYTERKGDHRELIHRADAEAARLEHCIVPLNDSGQGLGVKPEMMLPVCDPGFMPSAKEPHKYLARKRRVPPPYKSCGVVYPNLEYPRMTSYVPGKPRDGADIPFDNEDLSKIPNSTERISVTSLTGLPFTRRRFLAQREQGVIPGTATSVSNQERNGLLPYMRAKAII